MAVPTESGPRKRRGANELGIRSKLLIASVVAVAILLIQVWLVRRAIGELQVAVETVSTAVKARENALDGLDEADKARKTLAQISDGGGGSETLQVYWEALDEHAEGVGALGADLALDQAALEELDDALGRARLEYAGLAAAGGDADARLEKSLFLDEELASVAEALGVINVQAGAALQRALEREKAIHDKPARYAWGSGGAAAVLLFLGAWLFAGRLVKPLRAMTAAVDEMAAGRIDLESRLEVTRDDEIGRLGRGFNLMTEHLAKLVEQVQQSGIQITSAATELSASSKQLEATVSEQVASTNQVVATAKQISATSQELVGTMNEVSQLADEVAGSASSSQTGLNRMEEAMRDMESATRSISDKLGVINERAANITSVVTTITKVADQTNLLSLNAAIEAERAGEYGQGFAVVAREIRRLADQTAVATLDIERIVKDMASAVSAGVMGMDQFAQEVRSSVDDVRAVGAELAQIIEQVQAVTPRFEVVNEGMQSQSEGAQQINESMLQLSEAARQTADSIRESTGSINQLNDAAQGLHEGISRLSVAS